MHCGILPFTNDHQFIKTKISKHYPFTGVAPVNFLSQDRWPPKSRVNLMGNTDQGKNKGSTVSHKNQARACGNQTNPMAWNGPWLISDQRLGQGRSEEETSVLVSRILRKTKTRATPSSTLVEYQIRVRNTWEEFYNRTNNGFLLFTIESIKTLQIEKPFCFVLKTLRCKTIFNYVF